MRLTWSVPLPGPFRLSGRVGGRRRTEGGLVVTALAYVIVTVVWLVVILAWCVALAAAGAWNLGAALVRRLQGK